MRKSQRGLLQTLLCNILRQRPNLIPKIVPTRWEDPILRVSAWTPFELGETFSKLWESSLLTSRFCFFIDGLDGYEGDHSDITNIIDGLTDCGIKICFSSLQWNVFEIAYGENMGFKISIQDHTSEYISTFVMDQLEEDVRFVRLRDSHVRYRDLGAEIIERANGVYGSS